MPIVRLSTGQARGRLIWIFDPTSFDVDERAILEGSEPLLFPLETCLLRGGPVGRLLASAAPREFHHFRLFESGHGADEALALSAHALLVRFGATTHLIERIEPDAVSAAQSLFRNSLAPLSELDRARLMKGFAESEELKIAAETAWDVWQEATSLPLFVRRLEREGRAALAQLERLRRELALFECLFSPEPSEPSGLAAGEARLNPSVVSLALETGGGFQSGRVLWTAARGRDLLVRERVTSVAEAAWIDKFNESGRIDTREMLANLTETSRREASTALGALVQDEVVWLGGAASEI